MAGLSGVLLACKYICVYAINLPPARSLTRTRSRTRTGHSGHAQGGKHGDMATFGLPLPLFKIILQLLLTGLNVVCWLVPMKIKRFRENQQLISLANAFSGGVFLSLAFGHMIPHAMDGFDAAVSKCGRSPMVQGGEREEVCVHFFFTFLLTLHPPMHALFVAHLHFRAMHATCPSS